MTVVVVNETEGSIVGFGRKAEGVFGKDGAELCCGRGRARDGTEGGVVIVRGDAVLRGVVEYLGDVLVAVVGVEEVETL